MRQELAPDKLAPVTPIDPESIEVVGPADGGRPERPIDNVGEMGLPVLRYSFDRGRVPSYQVKLTGDFEDHQSIHSGVL